MRVVAYAALLFFYFLFGVMGGSGSGWTSTLALNASAGCATGFFLLFLEYEWLRA